MQKRYLYLFLSLFLTILSLPDIVSAAIVPLPRFQGGYGIRTDAGGRDKVELSCEGFGGYAKQPGQTCSGRFYRGGLTCYRECLCDTSTYKYTIASHQGPGKLCASLSGECNDRNGAHYANCSLNTCNNRNSSWIGENSKSAYTGNNYSCVSQDASGSDGACYICACPSGWASGSCPANAASCSSCKAVSPYTVNKFNLISCKAGYYKNGNACVQCPAGSYCDGSSKNTCPGGSYSAAGASSCSQCGAGQYSAAGASSCSSCAAGTYSAAGSSSCGRCSAGTYSGAGASSCTSCSAGKYSSAGASYCNTCAAGTYSAAGASSCTSCSAGKYSSAGASYCNTCAAGTYSGAGASSCTSCSAGKYSSAGASYCNTCAAGTYSGAGASSCTSCSAGKYSSAGASSCSTCSAGTYSGAGASSCTSCSAGKYSSAGASSCSSCSGNTYSAAGASGCTSCPSGYKANSNHTGCEQEIIDCPSGYQKTVCTGNKFVIRNTQTIGSQICYQCDLPTCEEYGEKYPEEGATNQTAIFEAGANLAFCSYLSSDGSYMVYMDSEKNVGDDLVRIINLSATSYSTTVWYNGVRKSIISSGASSPRTKDECFSCRVKVEPCKYVTWTDEIDDPGYCGSATRAYADYGCYVKDPGYNIVPSY